MSADRALVVEKLTIRRTPGIADAFPVATLCPGVNLIHGPNGSGKTSTARAIQAALWPAADAAHGLALSAGYTLDGVRYQVTLDGEFAAVQREGHDAPPPALPLPELRQRYLLSLHELVRASAEGDLFAAHIAKESAGGFDFDAAAKQAGCREKPSGTGADSKAHKAAVSALKAAQARQASLHAEGRALADLDARRAEAAPAAGRVRVLEKAIRHAQALRQREASAERLGAFPEVMARVRGDELERLTDLDARAAGSVQQRSGARDAVEAEEGEARALFPDGAPSPSMLAGLRERSNVLASIGQARDEAERRVGDTAAQLREARLAVGAAASDERLSRIDGLSFPDLAALAREAEALRAEEAAVAAALAGAGVVPDLPTASSVQRALVALQGWLRADAEQARVAAGRPTILWSLLAVALAALGWLLLGLYWHPLAYIGVAIALVVAFLSVRDGAPAADGRQAQQEAYGATALAPPAAWTVDAVVRHIEELYAVLERVQQAVVRADRVREAEGRGAAAVNRRAELDRRAVEITMRLGVPGDRDPRELYALVERLARWQVARQAHAGAVAAFGVASARLTTELRAIGDALAPFGFPAPATPPDATGAVHALVDRMQQHAGMVDRAASARARMAEADAALAMIDRERAALLATIDIAAGAVAGLADLCAQHAAYQQCAEQVRAAEAECARSHDELIADVAFDPTLRTMPIAMLEEQRGRAEQLAAEHGSLVERATALRTRVEAAKSAHDVEEALTAVADAEDALRALQARDLRAMAGDALLRYARDVTRDAHLPEVFRRSRELLARITGGRLQLEFTADADNPPAFRAIDTTTGHGMSLDELSSGSRLQLLLAVRVAFVESQEHGVRIPLLLDETLATSDDRRAQAIIEAVIALAEGGRQVFYFTAQSDEVTRWIAALSSRGAPYTVIDLGAARGLGPVELPPLPVAPRAPDWRLTTPAVNGHTHESFGSAIRVPAIRVGRDHVGAAHVWYLVDDLAALDHLIAVGVTAWGELEALHTRGGATVLADHPGVFARAAAFADALTALHDGAAVGRGRTVDREAITACDAVSAGKREEVVALAAQCGGDAAAVLDGLRRGEVSRFHKSKIEELEAHFRAGGYLDSAAPQTPAEIRVGMLARCAGAIGVGTITADDLDALLRRLQARAAASSGSAAAGGHRTAFDLGASSGRYLST